jgi:predicted dehydrogenase
MPDKLNVAIVGCGAISKGHVKGIAASQFGHLALVMDTAETAAKGMSEATQTPYVTDFDEVIAKPEIDVVIIGTPHFLHAPQALAAIQAGKHVYVEKPMALSTADCTAMILAAKKKKVKLMVGHNYRYKPGAMAIKEAIKRDVLGDIYEIRMQFVADIYQAIVPGKWREDRKKGGGGSLLELGLHELDMLRYWLDQEPERVYAEMSFKDSKSHVDRLTGLSVWFKDTLCTVTTGYHKRTFYVKEIHGTKGCMTINAFPDRNVMVFFERDRGRPLPVPDDQYHGHLATALFVDAVAENKPVPVPGEDGKKSNDIMLAAYLSAHEHRVVKMPLKEKVSLPL